MPVNYTFNTPGTYTIEDDGIRGNGVSVIRNAAGAVVFTITHPADAVNLTVSTAGVNLVINALDPFGTANFNVGLLGSPASSPDSITVKYLRTDAFVSLISNGSITEGGADAPADILAAGLVMSAATGIGTPGNAIETQIVFVEGVTTTGGINIVNSGNVQVGGLTAAIRGLDVVTSGDLSFTTTGFMLLADASGTHSVHGGVASGNVTLTALGAEADIFTNINQKMISAAGGGITLSAGRDVVAGTGGTNFDNDIQATAFVTIHAGRDFVLDGTSNVQTGAFGGLVGGPIVIETGRNITLSNTTGGLETIAAYDGPVTLSTGPGGAFVENAASPGAISNIGAHDINLNADVVQINSGGLNNQGIGAVNIRTVTPGRAIDIGATVDAVGALSLSDAEIDQVFSLYLNVGDANAGPIEFTAPLTPYILDYMSATSATEILVRSSINYAGTLVLRAGDDIYFTAAGSFTSSTGSFAGFVDQAQNDGGAGGVGDIAGSSSVAGSNTLTGSVDADTLNGGTGHNVLIGLAGADRLNGGSGNDTADYSPSIDRVAVDLAAGTGLGGDAHGDVLTGIENLVGTNTSMADFLTGDGNANVLSGLAGNDQLRGAAGNDVLRGGAGADLLDGGADSDTADYSTSADRVAVNLATGSALGGDAQGDTLAGIENLTGTNSAMTDFLTGNGSFNILTGLAGDDVLTGGGSADTLDGGSGNDTADYSTSADRVSVNLAAGTALGGDAHGDSLLAIENLTGTNSSMADFLSGDGNANVLTGLAGPDELSGRGGNDTFVYLNAANSTVAAPDKVLDFEVGIDKIDVSAIDANAFVAGNSAFAFIGSAAFTPGNVGELRAAFDSGAGVWRVEGETNGDGVADFQILVTVVTPGSLTASDFML
jgi:hypothetical protein